MQYLLSIYQQESDWTAITDAERQSIYKEYSDLVGSLVTSGHYLGGNELAPVSTATTVRVRDGKRSVTDGPFAETKEQLGGYFLVEAADLDEAIAIAERIPSARRGSIEVRPTVPHTNMPS